MFLLIQQEVHVGTGHRIYDADLIYVCAIYDPDVVVSKAGCQYLTDRVCAKQVYMQ